MGWDFAGVLLSCGRGGLGGAGSGPGEGWSLGGATGEARLYTCARKAPFPCAFPCVPTVGVPAGFPKEARQRLEYFAKEELENA